MHVTVCLSVERTLNRGAVLLLVASSQVTGITFNERASVCVSESRCILLPVVLRLLQTHLQEQRDLVMCAQILTSMLSIIKRYDTVRHEPVAWPELFREKERGRKREKLLSWESDAIYEKHSSLNNGRKEWGLETRVQHIYCKARSKRGKMKAVRHQLVLLNGCLVLCSLIYDEMKSD